MTVFLSLQQAISEYVNDGATVALEGFTHLIRMTPDLIYDQLIGMGCARKLVFSWGATGNL